MRANLVDRLLAASIGMAVAAVALASAEKWQRQGELGELTVVVDPPGIKYAFSASAQTGGRGWQEGVPPRPKPAGTARVVAVGDSVTWGVSVEADQVWPACLGRALGEGVEVLNFGVNGWDAEQVATLARARLAAWDPDVVVWGTFTNDLEPTVLLFGRDRGHPVYVGTTVPENARLLPEAPSLWLVRHSAIWRRLQGARYARVADGPGRIPASADFYARWLDSLAGWATDRGIPLVVLAIAPHVLASRRACPASFGGNDQPCAVAQERYDTLTRLLEARGVRWADGLAAWRATGRRDFHPTGRPDPDHPDAEGHRVLAEAVLPPVRAALHDP